MLSNMMANPMLHLAIRSRKLDQPEAELDSAKAEPVLVKPQQCPLLRLPPEIIQQILSWLPCRSLVSLGRACRQLRESAAEDLLWQRLLRSEIPGCDFPDTPFPSTTFRDLYLTHHPYWFVPRNKIWISDYPYVGRIMMCRFDPRRGCIEGYRILAERGASQIMQWPRDPGVIIHSFKPCVRLWLDDPVLKLAHQPTGFNTKLGWREGEIRMSIGLAGYHTSASFFLSRNIPDTALHQSMEVWPPRTIPDMPRVRGSSGDKFRAKSHKPQSYEQISQTTFRMRHWSQYTSGRSTYGVRIGEEVTTWSTLDPALYTPTQEKPYQGIFVGDYAGHGCEFLLIMQTDRAPPMRPEQSGSAAVAACDLNLGTVFPDHLNEEQGQPSGPGTNAHTRLQPTSWSTLLRFEALSDLPGNSAIHDDPSIFHGAIEAVKLTGDPNVPRGEHSFIADDIGPAGFIRIATERPFVGARVVRSRGHIAARAFLHDTFIPSQLFLISHDRLAQYWVPYGHISLYNRVDVDDLVKTTFNSDT